jgi:hypothetical protein
VGISFFLRKNFSYNEVIFVGGRVMLIILAAIVILAIIFYGICQLISILAGIFFICISTIILLKLSKVVE